jgi:predicted outer membrane repeat protein
MLKSVWFNGPRILLLATAVMIVVVGTHAGSSDVSSSTRKILPRHSAKCTLKILGGGKKLSIVQYNTMENEYLDGFDIPPIGRLAAAAAGQAHVPTLAATKLQSIALHCQSDQGPIRVFVNSNLITNRAAQQFTGVQPSYYNGSGGRALGNDNDGGGGGGEGAVSSADCPDGRLPAASRALLHFCGDLHLEILNLTVEGVQLTQDIKPSRDPIPLNISSPVVLFGSSSSNSHLTVNILRAHIVNSAAHAALLVHGSSSTRVNITNMLCRGNLGQSGACLAVTGAAVVRLSSSVIDNCTAVRGAGLFVSDTANVGIDNCTFSHCVGCVAGGAIQVRDLAVLNITNSRFTSNRVADLDGMSGRGGAIAVVKNAKATVYVSLLQNNTAAFGGGAIFAADQASFDIINSTFLSNIAANHNRTNGYGGALSTWGNGTFVRAHAVIFYNNTAASSGGAVFAADQASFDVINSTFSSNIAANHNRTIGLGGALAAAREGTVVRAHAVIFHNNTASSGGAVHVTDQVSFDIINSTFSFNIAANHNRTNGIGGALTTWGKGTVVRATAVTFQNNTAAYSGGAVQVYHQAFFDVINSTFSFNTAANHNRTIGLGGALVVVLAEPVTVVNSVFDQNSAAASGGAVVAAFNTTLEIMDSNFSSNHVDKLSMADSGGGAIAVYDNGTVSVVRSSFVNNTAAGVGGAISVNAQGDSTLSLRSTYSGLRAAGEAAEGPKASVVSMQHCTFSRNSAKHEGGAFKVVSSNLTVLGSTLVDNGCTGRGAAGGVLNMYGTVFKPVHVHFEDSSTSRSTADTGGAVMAVVTLNGSAANSTCQGNEGVTHGIVDSDMSVLEKGSSTAHCVSSSLDWLNNTISGSTAYLGQEMVLEGRLLRVNLTGSNLMVNSSTVLRKGGRCLMGDKALTAAGVCELCPEHMYSLASDPVPQTCTPCPLHATCRGGAVILANGNFFNTFNTSNKCLPSDIIR